MTTTVTLPAAVKVHDKVEVPEPLVTDGGDKIHAELPLVKATVPVNPFNGATVMVEVAATPAVAGTVVGLAEMLKSGTPVTVTDIAAVELVMRLFVPPAPVMCTVKMVVVATVPVNEHVVVPVPAAARFTDAGLQVTDRPAGDEVELMATAPAKPLLAGTLSRLVRVTATPPLPPLGRATLVELDAMLNPST